MTAPFIIPRSSLSPVLCGRLTLGNTRSLIGQPQSRLHVTQIRNNFTLPGANRARRALELGFGPDNVTWNYPSSAEGGYESRRLGGYIYPRRPLLPALNHIRTHSRYLHTTAHPHTDMAIAPLSRSVHTSINYAAPSKDGDEAPYMYTYTPPSGIAKTNCEDDTRTVLIHDIRGIEESKTLDNAGFQFMKAPAVETEFLDDATIMDGYYKEVAALVKKMTGGKRTFIFDHTVRRDGIAGHRGPAKRAHVDQTDEAAIARVRRHLGEDAERLLKSRVRIVNVWRPIGNPVAHWPLACCDYSTINPKEDLVFTRHIYPDREGSNFGLKYNPGHKWYFLADQRPDEVILVKCYDSDDNVARLTPHTAFEDNGSPSDAPKRQSIEVRVLVFDAE